MNKFRVLTSYWSDTLQTNVCRCFIYCDSESDLPSINEYSSENITLDIGSEAVAIDTGKKYLMQSDGDWYEQPQSGGGGSVDAYTKSETDALLDERIPYETDNTIQAGDDLDFYYNVGSWYSPSTVLNSPMSDEFRLDVISISGDRVRQIAQQVGTDVRTYERSQTSDPTEITTANIPAMTSDTTPSGQVIYSGQYGTRYGYLAFDGVDSQTWQSNSWGDGTNALDGTPEKCYIGYEFTAPVKINSYAISFASDRVYVGIIQTRSNNVWTTRATVSISNGGYSSLTGDFESVVECDAVRFCVLSGTGERFTASTYGGNVCEFQVYLKQTKPTWSNWVRVDANVEETITSTGDLDDYIVEGTYFVTSGASSTPPGNTVGRLEIVKITDTLVQQRFTGSGSTNRSWTRNLSTLNPITWHPWSQVINTSAGVGISLSSNYDLNNLTDYGVYVAQATATASSIVHRPNYSSASNKMFVVSAEACRFRILQTMTVVDISAGNYGSIEIFERIGESDGSSWGSWHQINTTIVSDYVVQRSVEQINEANIIPDDEQGVERK